jgi:hypothetical protein
VDLVGTISSRADRDFYTFVAQSDGVVHLTSNGTSGMRSQVTVELERPAQKLLETEPNDGVTSGSFQVTSGQRVFIRVRSKTKAVGDYTVQLDFSGAGGGTTGGGTTGSGSGGSTSGGGTAGSSITERENNNTRARANVVALPDTGAITLLGTASDKRDEDFFVFTATESGRVSVTVGQGGGSLAKIGIEDNRGIKMMETEPKDGVHSGSFNVVAGRRYFLRLRSVDAGAASYQVQVSSIV